MPRQRTSYAKTIRMGENQLGWHPPAGQPITKWRAYIEKRLLEQKRDHPRMTPENLELAIIYLFKKKIDCPPLSLYKWLDEVLDHVNSTRDVVRPVADLIDEAIKLEYAREGDPTADYWRTRLARAWGDFRLQVLDEWRAAGRENA